MMDIRLLLFIAGGGATGAVLRYAASLGVYNLLGRGFPWGTLFVNVAGSFLMGILSVLFIDRLELGPEVRAAVLVGLLGAFTTFSTFSIETLNLLEQGDVFKAVLNMGVSLVLCVLAVWLGVSLGRQI